jgi:hypothetical protein
MNNKRKMKKKKKDFFCLNKQYQRATQMFREAVNNTRDPIFRRISHR